MSGTDISALRVAQSSQRQGSDWWTWSVWIEGDRSLLDNVAAVVYRLHPTFPNPVVRSTDAKQNFKLSATGWGSFTIGVEIHWKSGLVERRHHVLELAGENQGRVFLSFPHGADAKALQVVRAAIAEHGLAEWTSEDVATGAEWRETVEQAMADADIGVILTGREPSRASITEMHTLAALGKPLFLVGEGAQEQRGYLTAVTNVEIVEDVHMLGAALGALLNRRGRT